MGRVLELTAMDHFFVGSSDDALEPFGVVFADG